MSLFRYVCLCCLVGLMFACSSKPITPLSEPVFRLKTIAEATGCTTQSDAPCTWILKGKIDGYGVVSGSDNPFPNCQTCNFNQKFALKDDVGTVHYLYYRLPSDESVPLTQGIDVELTYVKAENIGRGYALALRRKKGNLLFAVASGPGGHYLTPDLLAPINLIEDQQKEAGRETSDCGSKVFRTLIFSSGENSTPLVPGEEGTLVDTNDISYRVANVNRYNREGAPNCGNLGEPPFSFYVFVRPIL